MRDEKYFTEAGQRADIETALERRDAAAQRRVAARPGAQWLVRIGMAPTCLKIAGRWQDVLLYQLINPNLP